MRRLQWANQKRRPRMWRTLPCGSTVMVREVEPRVKRWVRQPGEMIQGVAFLIDVRSYVDQLAEEE